MMPMSVAEIARAVSGRLAGGPVPVDAEDGRADGIDGVVATGAVSDSRQVSAGDVFVAIKGERVDGHDYVPSVAAKGAVAALVEHEVEGAALPQIVVDDAVEALGALARHNIERRRQAACERNRPFTLVALTGSVGKTTTKDLLNALLTRLGPTVAPVGSFNNEIGLPLTALRVGEDTRFLVAEMGANHVGEIARLTTIAPPDIAIVLKVGVAHLGEFGSVERIAQAKSEIVRGLLPGGETVLNAGDAHVARMAAIAPGKVTWFALRDDMKRVEAGEPQRDGVGAGIDAAAIDGDAYVADDVTVDELDRARFTLTAPDGRHADVALGIPGAHNAINALAAACVAMRLGLDLDDVVQVLAGISSISPHRMAVSTVELKATGDGDTQPSGSFTLIDDSFNANPDSMRAGIDGLSRWHRHAASDAQPFRIAVLGAMLELGGDEDGLHREVGAYAAKAGLDAIIAVGGGQGTSPDEAHLGELAESMAEGAEKAIAVGDGQPLASVSIDWVRDIDQADAAVAALARAHAGSVVLLKGSHASGLDALAERWAEQGSDHGA